MEILLAIVIGGLFAAAVYMILRRSLVKLVIGLILLGHAANLMIFTLGRLTRGEAAFIEPGRETLTAPFADPLPQALILTAIVIGFGVQAFALTLMNRAYRAVGSDDFDLMRTTEK